MSTAFEGLDKGSIVTPRARSGNRPNTSWSSTSKPLRRSVLEIPSTLLAIAPSRPTQALLRVAIDDRQWIRKCSLVWPGYLRRGGAVPPWADLYGLASHDRGLVGTDVGELDRPRRRGWPRFFRVKTCRARCTLKRVGPPE